MEYYRLPFLLAVLMLVWAGLGGGGPVQAAEEGFSSTCIDTNGNGRLDLDDCAEPENTSCADAVCTGGDQADGGLPVDQGKPANGSFGSACRNSADCDSLVCRNGKCQAPAFPDEDGGGDTEPPDDSADRSPASGIDFSIQGLVRLVTGVACWSIRAILAVMVIALIVAGFRFFLAHGEPTAAGNAKKNFYWVIIGIVVIMATNIIIATIADVLGAEGYSYFSLSCEAVDVDVKYPTE